MKRMHIPANWHGFGKPLAFALSFWAAFVAGAVLDDLQQPPETLAARKVLLYEDFGQLGEYRRANLKLRPDPHRIVFFGDSITFIWDLGGSFSGKPYLNRGINGQTTSQMLVRLRQDVLELQPASVVILAGTNDLGNTSTAPVPIPDIERNLETFAELAAAHRIRPIFASVLPVHNYTMRVAISAERTPRNILEINSWLRSYCAQHGYIYLDFHSAMVSSDGMMRRELSDDGVHPNGAGYKIMASITEIALRTEGATEQP